MPVSMTQPKKITACEWRLLRMLAKGISPTEISTKLSISIKTVSQHTANIERKLGLKNRLHLQKMLVEIKQHSDPLRSTAFSAFLSK